MDDFVSRVLLKWYDTHKRPLPWRETRDPYMIWISEVILQQTRVEQGTSYFLNFSRRFPDVKSLASAHEDEVMRYWQGLGYYSRARNLHRAAKDIMERFGGVFPEKYEEVLSLKGIGEYTAAAICSISYHQPYPAVDGNVFRVLSRLFAVDTPIDSGPGKKLFTQLAGELLNPESAGDYNQALMEFGALQCVPKSPDCGICPLSDRCAAFLQHKVSFFPVKQGKLKSKDRYFNYFRVRQGDFIYLNKRIGNDIWKGLYEFPLIETKVSSTFEEVSRSSRFKEMFSGLDEVTINPNGYSRRHILSHQIIHAEFYDISIFGSNDYFDGLMKVSRQDLERYAFPKLILGYSEKDFKRIK
ncbi:MAG: A/G-specific adenine glycosylase [Candidatus Azobacteroides sp.]|nr:A/G-specific adenine glycosylase [Candidatus Azobacteroides sp.]